MIRRDLNFRDQILQAVAIPDKKLKNLIFVIFSFSSALPRIFSTSILKYFQQYQVFFMIFRKLHSTLI